MRKMPGGDAAGVEVVGEVMGEGAEIAGDEGAVVELAPGEEVGVGGGKGWCVGIANLEQVKGVWAVRAARRREGARVPRRFSSMR
jgi:hypothetical protein